MFPCPDSAGYKPDQPRTGLKEEPRAVCLQSEGHVDASQLSGGILDWKPEEPQPEGGEHHFTPVSIFILEHLT